MEGQYIDRPGVDLARVVKDGRMYPVTMTIPIGGGADSEGRPLSPPIPGFDIPSHDTVTLTEDANENLLSVVYSLDGDVVNTLNFTYVGYTPVAPNKVTIIEKV
jgi:hypothetical protein